MVAGVFTILIAVAIFTNVYTLPAILTPTENPSVNKRNPEETNNLFEGDIIRPPQSTTRGVAKIGNSVRWPNGIVPYEFVPGYTAEQQAAIVSRMRKLESLVAINNVRCIQFQPKVSSDLYYIKIQNGSGCSSHVGKEKDMLTGQPVVLQYPNCFNDGTIMHELIHALGFYHEQSRPDRDSYVKINLQNVEPEKTHNFEKYNNTAVNILNTPYDYASVMHYEKTAFSANLLPTVEPLKANVKIGQRYKLTPIDIQEIRLFYECSATGPTLPPTTTPTPPVTPGANPVVYSSELTSYNGIYSRSGGFAANYYYETIQVTVPMRGLYRFQCDSYLDSFASVYYPPFNPSNPAANIFLSADDSSNDNWEFSFSLDFPSASTVILVVTTYSPNVTGPFSIVATGPARATFIRTSSTVNPITTTTTTPSTGSTSCFPTSWNSAADVVARGSYYAGLAVDDNLNIYVSDGNNRRLQKWIPGAAQPVNLLEGQFSHSPLFFHALSRSLYFINEPFSNPAVYKLELGKQVPVKIAFGNGLGAGLNQLQHNCRDIYVTKTGDIYVLDAYNERVLKWTVNANSGILVAGGGGSGNGPTQLSDAHGLYVDEASNTIYVADTGNHRIQKYTTASVSGVTTIGGVSSPLPDNLNQLMYPKSVFVNRNGDILIGDWPRITKWKPGATSGTLVANGNQGSGTNVVRMDTATVLTLDKHGNLYCVDWTNQRVLKFNSNSITCAGWLNTGSLVQPRFGHTASVLTNGKVLVTGGWFDYKRYLNSAELYDPSTGIWTTVANMNNARQYHTASVLTNGKVLITGGQNSLTSTELYDPSTGKWTIMGNLNNARQYHTASVLSNGKILVTGGYDGTTFGLANSAELYNPSTGTWTLTATMNNGRSLHTASILTNGKVLVTGGVGANGYATNKVELYDPSTGTWTTTGDMKQSRYSHTASVLMNGKVLVTGGVGVALTSLNSAELYDPSTGTWTTTTNMNQVRKWHTSSVLTNGKVLIIGGSNDDAIGLNSVELYDPLTLTWTSAGNMNNGRYYPTSSVLTNGKILVAGGFGNRSYPNIAELYYSS